MTRLLASPLPVASRQRLAVVAGHLAGLAGSLAFDLRDERKALAYFKVAVQAADDAGRRRTQRRAGARRRYCGANQRPDATDRRRGADQARPGRARVRRAQHHQRPGQRRPAGRRRRPEFQLRPRPGRPVPDPTPAAVEHNGRRPAASVADGDQEATS